MWDQMQTTHYLRSNKVGNKFSISEIFVKLYGFIGLLVKTVASRFSCLDSKLLPFFFVIFVI